MQPENTIATAQQAVREGTMKYDELRDCFYCNTSLGQYYPGVWTAEEQVKADEFLKNMVEGSMFILAPNDSSNN